ncbi:MAG: sugar ABC transporter substrate-binding protein [Steroidobacteraceae bacterium]
MKPVKTRALAAAVAMLSLAVLAACENGTSRPVQQRTGSAFKGYYDSLRGKRVGFVPIAMGFDLTEAWHAGMQRQAQELGYEIVVRDPNWSIETGIQAINSLIADKPDVLVIQNNDGRSYRRAIQRAMATGIPVIQVQQRIDTPSNFFVGPDFADIGARSAQAMREYCGRPDAPSKKIALVQGSLTAPASMDMLAGVESELEAHPGLVVVSSQATEWDATKAYQIMSTVLKKHADLCGVIGFWDVTDVGTAGAIREAGLQGKVALITSGGGNRRAACDRIRSGEITLYYSYNVAGQVRDLNTAIKTLLQAGPQQAVRPVALVNPLIRIDRDTLAPASCWTLEELRQSGG